MKLNNKKIVPQHAVEARNANYATIVKNLTFSKRPWYDLQVWPDESEERMHRKTDRLVDGEASDSDSDAAVPDVAEPELIMVRCSQEGGEDATLKSSISSRKKKYRDSLSPFLCKEALLIK